MTKVKVTQEQAQELETLKSKNNLNFILNLSATRKLSKSLEIDKLNTEQIARAWIEGYEVEPQFKEGDIVVYRGTVGTIKEVYTSKSMLVKLERTYFVDPSDVRHATDNEKIFYELGREIGEFKEGDKYYTHGGGTYTVKNLEVAQDHYEKGYMEYLYPVESRKEFK